MKTFPFQYLFLIIVSFGCDNIKKSSSESDNKIVLTAIKEISIDLGNVFPKINGSPIFFNDKGKPLFYIQSNYGIGKFDLRKGGEAIEHLVPADINGYMSDYSLRDSFILPIKDGRYISYQRDNGQIYILKNNEIEHIFRLAKYDSEIYGLITGFYKQMDFEDGIFYGMFGLTQKYGKPPFKYEELSNFIFSINLNTGESDKLFMLPEHYLSQNFNVYDVLISMAKNDENDEFIINFPLIDEIYITKDFKDIRKLKLSPNDNFVQTDNRKGGQVSEWEKEYYMQNAFQTIYYDSFRKMYIRHYRKALTETEFNRINQDSFKMHDPTHENRLLFSDLKGNILADIDVSDFNYWYIHFAEEGMYILNDTELIGEDNMTFTLFDIKTK